MQRTPAPSEPLLQASVGFPTMQSRIEFSVPSQLIPATSQSLPQSPNLVRMRVRTDSGWLFICLISNLQLTCAAAAPTYPNILQTTFASARRHWFTFVSSSSQTGNPLMNTLPSWGPDPPRSSNVLLPREAALVVWNTGTSVVLLVVASFSSLPAIMSATEAATSILLGVDGGLVVEPSIRILGERFVKNVGKRGRNKVSVLLATTVRAVVIGWKRTGVLLGSKRGSPVPVKVGSRLPLGRTVSVESLGPVVPALVPRVTLV